MRNAVTAALLALMLTGCSSLFPGRVEHFQKKVKPVPTAALQPALVEAQKQAAQFVDKKVSQAQTAAAATSADVSVQVPLAEAATVSGPLVTSLGPPASPWTGTAPKLAVKMDGETAKLDKKVAAYAVKTAPLVGKEIEGTGLIQIGFFTQWALVLGVLALGWVALKVYGMVNPAVGAGTKVAERVTSSALAAGFHQVVRGGEAFLTELKPGVSYTAEQVKKLFVVSHRQEQDSHVQDLVQRLTTA